MVFQTNMAVVVETVSPLANAPADSVLLRRFAETGDDSCFSQLLLRHRRLVWGVCSRVLSNPADIEDAFQITWLSLLKNAERVRGTDCGPWLYRVAMRSAVRVQKLRSGLPVSSANSDSSYRVDGVLDDIERRERLAHLAQAIAGSFR